MIQYFVEAIYLDVNPDSELLDDWVYLWTNRMPHDLTYRLMYERGEVKEKITSELFDSGIPIENRRAAIKRASHLAQIIAETDQYLDMGQMAQIEAESGLNGLLSAIRKQPQLFTCNVYARIGGGAPLYVARQTKVDGEALESWIKECSYYLAKGYSVGADQPVEVLDPRTSKFVKVLPDVAPVLYGLDEEE